MDFKCRPNSHKFTLEKPENITGAWAWRGEIKCPMCGSEDLEEVMMVASVRNNSKGDLVAMRKENRLATMHAKRQAAEARHIEREIDPEVMLAPIDKPGRRSRFGQGPLPVKKSILDSLAKKGEALEAQQEK